jgi:hypothetical protein
LASTAVRAEDPREQYTATVKRAVLKLACVGLSVFWDKKGKKLATDAEDRANLQKAFEGYTEQIAPLYVFMLSKLFAPRPFTLNGINFYMPYGGDSGLALDKLLRERFASLHRLPLIAKDGKVIADYATPVPDLTFPPHAEKLDLNFAYSAEEEIKGQTVPNFTNAGTGSATMTLSTGFLRTVLLGCIYAIPIVRESRTLLWQRLKLESGTGDAVLVNAPDGLWSMSLLPLLCVTDPAVYIYQEDQKQFRAVLGAFWRVYDCFESLKKGGRLPSVSERTALNEDIATLDALSQLYFLTLMFIVSHETAHAFFMHQVTSDLAQSANNEQVADNAATVHLFLVALTNTLNSDRTWTGSWRYSQLGSQALEDKLLWYERLFGFGIANNIALRLLSGQEDPYHPTRLARWGQNVRLWNNCALACSRTERPSA